MKRTARSFSPLSVCCSPLICSSWVLHLFLSPIANHPHVCHMAVAEIGKVQNQISTAGTQILRMRWCSGIRDARSSQ